MDSGHGIDTSQSHPPGTLETFHLGLAADGTSCAMVFVDEDHRSIACVASYADLNGLIVSLTQAAAELARRRTLAAPDEAAVGQADGAGGPQLFNVVASTFQEHGEGGHILGTLVDECGRVVPLRLRQDIANELTRNLLKVARVASAC